IIIPILRIVLAYAPSLVRSLTAPSLAKHTSFPIDCGHPRTVYSHSCPCAETTTRCHLPITVPISCHQSSRGQGARLTFSYHWRPPSLRRALHTEMQEAPVSRICSGKRDIVGYYSTVIGECPLA